MKSIKIKDERVLQLNNKIQSEAYFIVLFIACASIFTKSYVLDMSFAQYAVELAILLVSLAYVTIRSMFLGHSLMDTSKKGKHLTIFANLIMSLVITIVNGIRNFTLYGDKYTGIFDGHFIAVIAVTFISAFIFTSIVLVILYQSNKSGQERIERKLNDEDEKD